MASNSWNYDNVGGAYKIATDFAIFCAEKGWDVHFICAHELGKGEKPGIECGVKVWRYSKPKKSGKGTSLENFYGHLRGSGKIFRKISATVGHDRTFILNGHTALQYLGILNAANNHSVSSKAISVHSPLADEYLAENGKPPFTLKARLASWLLRKIESSCYQKSDVIQCDSEFTQSLLQKSFQKETHQRLAVCPGYVDFEQFSLINMPRSQAREKLGTHIWPLDEVCLFSLRRHVERTGIDNLIKAIDWLRTKLKPNSNHLKFRLIIGGDGPLKPKLEALTATLNLNSHIKFIGKISESEVALAYRAADCFVLPSRSLECFGLVILESFAVGTPVIATPVGAIPEVLGPFAADSLADGTSPEDIGKTILKFFIEGRHRYRAVDSSIDLYQYARKYEKKTILSRLENIVIQGQLTSA